MVSWLWQAGEEAALPALASVRVWRGSRPTRPLFGVSGHLSQSSRSHSLAHPIPAVLGRCGSASAQKSRRTDTRASKPPHQRGLARSVERTPGTPAALARWILPSSSPLARSGLTTSVSPMQAARGLRETRRGGLSRSVRCGLCLTRSCLPDSTIRLGYNVEHRIVITIKHHATGGTDMGPHTERLLDACSIAATLLGGELQTHCVSNFIVYQAILFYN